MLSLSLYGRQVLPFPICLFAYTVMNMWRIMNTKALSIFFWSAFENNGNLVHKFFSGTYEYCNENIFLMVIG